jgi:hypothetical protein
VASFLESNSRSFGKPCSTHCHPERLGVAGKLSDALNIDTACNTHCHPERLGESQSGHHTAARDLVLTITTTNCAGEAND